MEEILQEQRMSITNAFKNAQEESTVEDRVYAMIGEILKTVSTVVAPADKTTSWIAHSQPLLIPHTHRRSATKEYMNVRPDFGFLLSDGKTIPRLGAIFEAKRLHDAHGSPWTLTDAGLIAHNLLFDDSIGQLLREGYGTLNAYPQEKYIYIFFMVGVWFTFLRFERPSQLAPVPESLLPADHEGPIVAIEKDSASADLVPEENCPEIIYFGESLMQFTRVDAETARFSDPVVLTSRFCRALSLCIPEPQHMKFRPCNFFAASLNTASQAIETADLYSSEDRLNQGRGILRKWYQRIRDSRPKTPTIKKVSLYEESPLTDSEGNVVPEKEHTPYRLPGHQDSPVKGIEGSWSSMEGLKRLRRGSAEEEELEERMQKMRKQRH